MWKFIRENRRMLVLTVLALLAGMVIGFFIGLSVSAAEEETRQTGSVGFASILPETMIERQVAFAGCGHQRCVSIDAGTFVGYTKAELEAFYDDCSVIRFDGERVILLQPHAGFCPDHYLLKTGEEGALCVYRTDDTFFTERLIQVLGIRANESMAQAEREMLKSGVAFDSLPEIDAYLESLES